MSNLTVKRALISVSDKTGLIAFAKKLSELGIQIISTDGSAKTLKSENIPVILVSDITQFPEMMSGRVKTLHPKIHGGILGKRDLHASEAIKYNIPWIDLVVCNLYPFSQAAEKGLPFSDCIEQIDIGGPAMIRAAAKNMEWVTVVNDPVDYDLVVNAIQNNEIDLNIRKKLSAKAFAHTAHYDAIIAHYLNSENMPEQLNIPFKKIMNCRYGENPHQHAAVYRNLLENEPSILDAKLLQGKPLSYNNVNDASAALNTLIAYQEPACVIVKHANPCGVAIAEKIEDAFEKAWHADSLSAFGGIVALNKMCTEKIAEFLTSVFIEVIIAPAFSDASLSLFSKKPNIRVLLQENWPSQFPTHSPKWINGGLLWQTADDSRCDDKNFRVVTKVKPTDAEISAMRFAWPVLKQLKSNAILIAKSDVTLGMGMGQVSRIDAVECAIKKAGSQIENAILASDAFFPFTDNIELIAKTQIKAIVQPGGSIKDEAVIAACDHYGIAMVFTGQRCFNH
ncbi:MAG: bifunctional phosphoribosylaminoimidazolecarboxamide formyltransferase/IMP cyclohydrolase [Gammaproteobacteria bacterium RIFCSPLOWO2_02_FULL_42_14]|nr:MAG: bifunctional phosphoribosylaminoimidazolecarboxamide formyltransferase/IMP cyclohydrolase [Gammaproteobacteria bacterium RIFCSPHIGHO2_02_FULL_42_43]OGT29303.1 MAG: bifunctional phosphoribosylaminoimidazolecarboxamide formyltransferase/IMP cyclohydrolase [Gammaproteobacteria bacterium RIFCSPHIGHO2_01_FULL_42_8]OGT50756.1 MAG: bifunctional phosphoribosylaminoimidazolecarboxamide formyltransferase/IMP cyclohydrolase [Gammaproteobacteria bacterium RIFCSPHIGHO2_12_FULL_41_25]OGT61741.1 MAG: b